MFNFLGNIFNFRKNYLGFDIGTTSIKVAEVAKSGGSAKLLNYAILESSSHFDRPNNVIQANSLKISERETVAMLKILLKKVKFGTNLVMASIPSFASFITFIEMPDMSEEETNKAMSFQIRQSIPLPLSEIAVDWIRVGKKDDESGFSKQQILLVAIPNEVIDRYKNIFKQVGLNLRSLEVENLAYVRSVIGGDKTPTALVDIGARSTNISIIENGFLKYNIQSDYAGDSLTFAISKGLSISYRRAEELKKQRGISGEKGEFELSTLEIPFIDVIINGVMKAGIDFESNFNKKIQRVVLIGGGANLLGIEKYFEQQLNLPTVLGNGLLFAEPPQGIDVVLKEVQTRLATAIGLSLKSLL